MSDEIKKQLDTALARIAALESTRQAPAPANSIDPKQLTQALIANPVGVLQQLGVPVDHVAKFLVGQVLGNDAPEALRNYAVVGQTASAVHQTQSELHSLRQRVEHFETEARKAQMQQSFSALAGDKTKYPLLSAAVAKDPALFRGEIDSHKGDAAALADTIEGRLKALAPLLGAPQTASSGNADDKAQSTQSMAQSAKQPAPGGIDPTPPPIPQQKPGVFTQEEHQALKDRIIAKYQPSKGSA